MNSIEVICSLCWTRRGQQGGLGEWAMNMDEEIHTHTKLHCAHYCILQKHCLVTSNSLCNVTFFNNFCKKPPENYAVTSLCYITALDQAKMDKMQHCAQGRIAQALVWILRWKFYAPQFTPPLLGENVSSRLMLVINRIYEPSPYNLTA